MDHERGRAWAGSGEVAEKGREGGKPGQSPEIGREASRAVWKLYGGIPAAELPEGMRKGLARLHDLVEGVEGYLAAVADVKVMMQKVEECPTGEEGRAWREFREHLSEKLRVRDEAREWLEKTLEGLKGVRA